MRHILCEHGCWFEEDHPVRGNWTFHQCSLHASAPDLLAALKVVTVALYGADLQLETEFTVGDWVPDPAIAVGRAAIAKVKP